MVTCQKNLGSVGTKKKVVPGSGILFRYFIFEISGKPSFVESNQIKSNQKVLFKVGTFYNNTK
jgi:hypothetical protein